METSYHKELTVPHSKDIEVFRTISSIINIKCKNTKVKLLILKTGSSAKYFNVLCGHILLVSLKQQ